MTVPNPALTETEAEAAAAPPAPDRGSDHSPIQALRNVVTNYGALFISSLTNILLTPIMLAALGPSDFGILRVATSLFGYLGLLDLGISTSIIYFVARYHSTGERAELNRYVSTIFNAIAVLAAVCVAGCFLAAPALAAFLRVPAESAAVAAWVIRMNALVFAANLIGGVFAGILVGRGRFDINNLSTIGYLTASAVGTYVLLRMGYGLLALVALNTVAAVAAAGARIVCSGLLRLATVALGRISGAVLRNAAGYGFWSLLNNVASQLSFATTDMVILSRVLGVSSVAVYSVALAPVALISQFVFQFLDVFQPMITTIAYRRGGHQAGVGQAMLLLIKTAVLLGWGPVLLLWLAGRQFLVFWVGAIGEQAGDLLIALTFAYGWNFVGHAVGLVLLGTAKHRFLGLVAIVGSSLNVVLSILFSLRFGLLGVAFATIIVMGITEMVLLPAYTYRMVGLPVRSYAFLVLRAALSLLASFGAGVAAGVAALEVLGPWGATAVECIAGGLIFLAAWWLVLCSKDERDLLVGVARGFLPPRVSVGLR